MSQDISRRNFIRNGTAGAAAVGIAGLAGCTSSLPFIGDDSSFEGDAWLFVPSYSDVEDLELTMEGESDYDDLELEEADRRDDREFDYVVPEEILDNEEEINHKSPVGTGSGSRDKFGVPATEVDWSLSQSFGWEIEYTYSQEVYGGTESREGTENFQIDIDVHAGSFDTDDVVDALERWVENDVANRSERSLLDEDPELESNGHQAEFDRYEIEEFAFGVHEDYLIEVDKGDATTPVDATAVLEAAIDARENGENLWTDEDDGEALLEHIEDGDKIDGKFYTPKTGEAQLKKEVGEEAYDELSANEREELEEDIVEGYEDWEVGLVGEASSLDVDGDTTDVQEVYVYESSQDVDREAFSDAVDTQRGYGETWEFLDDYSVEVDDRVIILTGTQRTRSAF